MDPATGPVQPFDGVNSTMRNLHYSFLLHCIVYSFEITQTVLGTQQVVEMKTQVVRDMVTKAGLVAMGMLSSPQCLGH